MTSKEDALETQETPEVAEKEDAPETQETPKIAEKVRFWEEQDRINRELIPRVIKQHELFTTHIEGHEDMRVQIAAMDARISEAVGEAVKQVVAESNKKMSELEERTALEVKSAKRQAQTVSGISLAVAVISIIIALVS